MPEGVIIQGYGLKKSKAPGKVGDSYLVSLNPNGQTSLKMTSKRFSLIIPTETNVKHNVFVLTATSKAFEKNKGPSFAFYAKLGYHDTASTDQKFLVRFWTIHYDVLGKVRRGQPVLVYSPSFSTWKNNDTGEILIQLGIKNPFGNIETGSLFFPDVFPFVPLPEDTPTVPQLNLKFE